MKIKEIVSELNMNQRMSLYHPDTRTYSSGSVTTRLPNADPEDIYSKSKPVYGVQHKDIAQHDADYEDPIAQSDKQMDQAKLKELVAKYIKQLAPKDRELVYMRFWQHMKFHQIGAKLGVTASYARIRLFKIIRKLWQISRRPEFKDIEDSY